MTRTQLNNTIDAVFNDSVADNSISPSDEATAYKLVADYVDERLITKTQGLITANSTPSLLQFDQNTVIGAGGIVYLPTTTLIGKEVYVNSGALISVLANVNSDAKITYQDPNSDFLAVFKMPAKSCVKFTSKGLGFWQAEDINQREKKYKVLLSYSGSFSMQEIRNDFGLAFYFNLVSNGKISLNSPTNIFNANKTKIKATLLNNGGQPYFVIGTFLANNLMEIDFIKFDGTQTSTPSFSSLLIELTNYN